MLQFKSAQRRALWFAVCFSLATEYVLVFMGYWVWSSQNGYSALWALVTVVAIQMFMALYGLLSLGRRAIWYYWFEREARAKSIADEFHRLNFPRPEGHYDDADHYLEQVALSPATTPEGAMFAGMLLGMLNGHRANGPRSEAIFLALSIERAMRLMLPWEARVETMK